MKKIFFALSLLAVAATASAAEFADTSVPDQMIDLGVRFGISSSNLSADIPHAGEECNFSWKRGFSTPATPVCLWGATVAARHVVSISWQAF